MSKKPKKKDEAENIKVLVRCRPLNEREKNAGMTSAVVLDLTEGTVQVNHVCGNPDKWTFDAVINNTYSQKDIFVQFINPMIDSVLEGFNATIFAYGQSGSGKTYTMTGNLEVEELCGIIPRSFKYIFNHIRERKDPNVTYSLFCSFLELYNGKIRDLLSKNPQSLNIKENKDKTFFVQDLSMPEVKFEQELMRHMEEGTVRRQVAATELNSDSSRSHSIFTVYIQMVEVNDDDVRTVTSKLNLVDLAGSERQSKTGASGDTLKEGCNINLSLSALGTVIDTIVKGKGHVPFRSSPLTMLLKDSLGGGSKTCMFANINPADTNVSETVSTLRFADRAKQIKNKPTVQMDAKDQKIQELINKVAEMQEKLARYEGDDAPDLEAQNEELEEKVASLEGDLETMRQMQRDMEMEHEEKVAVLTRDFESCKAKIENCEEQISQLTDELSLAQQKADDERRSFADLQEIIVRFVSTVDESSTLTISSELLDIEHALQHLADNGFGSGGGQTMAEFEEQLKDERTRHDEELRRVQTESQAEVQRLAELNDQAQSSLQAALGKLEKMKAKLDREREGKKQLQEEHRQQIDALKAQNEEEVLKMRSVVNNLDTSVSKLPVNIIAENVDEAVSKQLESYKEEIAQLRGQLAELQQEVERAGELEAKAITLEKQLEEAREGEAGVVSTYKDQASKAREAQLAAEAELDSALKRMAEPSPDDSAAIKKLKTELRVMQSTVSAVKEEKQELADTVDELRGEQSSLLREKSMLESRIVELEAASLKRRELAGAGLNRSATTDQVAHLEGKVAALECDVRMRDSTLSKVEDMYNKDVSLARKKLAQVADHREKLLDVVAHPAETDTEEVAQLKENMNTLRAELRDGRVEAETLQECTKRRTNDMVAREKEVLALKSRIQELEEQVNHSHRELVRTTSGDASAVQNLLEKRVGDLEKDLRAAHDTVQKGNQEVDVLRREVDEANMRTAELRRKLAEPSDNDTGRVKELKEELLSLDAKLQALQSKNRADAQALSEAQSRVLELESELSFAKKQLADQTVASVATIDSAALKQAHAEVARLTALLSTPSESDGDEVVRLKNEIKVLAEREAQLSKAVSEHTPAMSMDADKLRAEHDFDRAQNQKLKQELSIEKESNQRAMQRLQDEKNDLQGELEQVREELKQATLRTEQSHDSTQKVMKELEAAKGELVAMRKKMQEVDSSQRAIDKEREKWKKERESVSANISRLEQRLSEKEESVRKTREMYDKLNMVLEKRKRQEAELAERVKQLEAEKAEIDRRWEGRMEEEQEKWTRQLSRKLEEYQKQQEKLAAKKNEEVEHLRKKVKKAQLSVQKVKERYDTKVWEAESLRQQVEEMKEDNLKNLRNGVEDGRDEISNIIKASKAARSRMLTDSDEQPTGRRKEDIIGEKDYDSELARKSAASKKFDQGNTSPGSSAANSAVIRVRAAGAASAALNQMGWESGKGKKSRVSERTSVDLGESTERRVTPQRTRDSGDEERLSRGHSRVTNETPYHGINRDISPRVQFNPHTTSAERKSESSIVNQIQVSPRGPSSLNPYSVLSPSNSNPSSPHPTMGLGPSPLSSPGQRDPTPVDVQHDTLPLPKKSLADRPFGVNGSSSPHPLETLTTITTKPAFNPKGKAPL